VAKEEPKVGLYVELGTNEAFAVLSTLLADFRDAIEHQHRRQRQLRVAGAKKLAAAAGQQIFVFEAVPPRFHRYRIALFGAWLNSHAGVGNIPSLTGKDGGRPVAIADSLVKPVTYGLSVNCEAVASERVFSYINTKVFSLARVSDRPFGCEE
jgi:hypothetical protein